MSHTPGPWEADYVLGGGWKVRMAKPREGYKTPDPVCSMAWWQFDIPGIIDNEVSEANARLIAACPSMFELLQRIRQWDHLEMAGDGAYWKQQIDALINKATGAQEDGQ